MMQVRVLASCCGGWLKLVEFFDEGVTAKVGLVEVAVDATAMLERVPTDQDALAPSPCPTPSDDRISVTIPSGSWAM